MDFNWCWIFSLFAVLSAIVSPQRVAATTTDDCVYEGSTCAVNVQKCLPEGLNYSGEIAYTELVMGRGTVDFKAVIADKYIKENITYMVVSENNGMWQIVDGCCNVRLNESCRLRPQKPEEEFLVLVPAYGDTGYTEFYHYKDIGEVPHFTWCEVDSSSKCLQILDDVLSIYDKFESTSLDTLPAEDQKTYYFFKAPRQCVGNSSSLSDGLFVPDVRGIEMDFHGDEINVTVCGKGVKAIERTSNATLTTMIGELERTCGEIWCFYFRIGEYKLQNATCFTASSNLYKTKGDCEPVLWWIVVIIVVVLVTLSIALLILSRYAKSRLKYYLSWSTEIEKDIPAATRNIMQESGGSDVNEKRMCDEEDVLKVGDHIATETKGDDVTQKDERTENNNNPGVKLVEAHPNYLRKNGIENKNMDAEMKFSRPRVDSGCMDEISESTSRPSDFAGYTKKEQDSQACEGIFVDSGLGNTVSSGLSTTRSVGSEFRDDFPDWAFSCSLTSGSSSEGRSSLSESRPQDCPREKGRGENDMESANVFSAYLPKLTQKSELNAESEVHEDDNRLPAPTIHFIDILNETSALGCFSPRLSLATGQKTPVIRAKNVSFIKNHDVWSTRWSMVPGDGSKPTQMNNLTENSPLRTQHFLPGLAGFYSNPPAAKNDYDEKWHTTGTLSGNSTHENGYMSKFSGIASPM